MNLNFLEYPFDEEIFTKFIESAFDEFERKDTRYKDDKLSDAEKEHIEAYKYIGEAFLDDNSEIGVLILKSATKNIEKKRVAFSKIITKLSKTYPKEIILVAIYHENNSVWRLTFVSFDFKDGKQIQRTDKKRYTYELGKDIAVTTAKEQIELLFKNDTIVQQTLEEIFNVEKVSKEFFLKYKKLYFETREALKPQIAIFGNEKELELFTKKLIGRVVFLYFLQKKGWLGVKKSWGDGDKKFLTKCFEGNYKEYTNFYNDILKDIFFEALNTDRSKENNIFKPFGKMPYLNGGLFSKQDIDRDKRLNIENNIFEKIITTFNQYNFTIIEDTPHESEVAIDPEMLGRIFEDLLEDRKDTGAFYTPREIVHYMCQQSILNYLMNTIDDKALVEKFVIKKELDKSLDKKRLEKLLKEIKVLDPTIGSGAFPMGMLHEIVSLLELVSTDKNLKRSVIQNSIYGVDIEASAVEIAKLRFWLSIVVDEEKPTPLPNLFYKIMVGNSLIETINGFDPLVQNQNKTSKKELQFLKEKFIQFFNTNDTKEKEKLDKQIKENVKTILSASIKNFDIQPKLNMNKKEQKAYEDNYQKHLTLKGVINDYIKNNASTELFFYKIYFKEVIDSGGFDVVIGNPPYIMEDENKEAFNNLHSFECYQGKTDIWHLFTCKGIDLLKDQGIISFIAKNQWLNSASSSQMRKKLYSDSELKYIIDFGANMVFENASVQTMILLTQKNKSNKHHNINYFKFPNIKLAEIKQKLLKRDISFIKKIIPKEYNPKENLTFSQYENILIKIDAKRNFTFDEKKEIIQGIIGAPDKAFILKEEELINFNSKEKKYIKMLHTNTQKFFTPKSDKYIFYISKKNFDKQNIDDYPNIKKAFLPYKDELLQKKINYKTPTKPYFYLHRERDENFFKEGDKIVFTSRTKGKTFTYTKEPFYGTRNLFFIKSNRVNLKYMIALLNSQLMYFYMQERLKHTGDLLQIDKNQFMKISLFVPKDTKPFEVLVDYIMLLKTLDEPINEYVPNSHIVNKFEEVLDAMVYELYFGDEFESKLIQFEKEKGYIKFIEYAKEDYASIEGLDKDKSIEIIHQSYQTLREPYNKIRNNLILIDIEFSDFIKPIKESIY